MTLTFIYMILVLIIGLYAFYDCTGLFGLTIPKTMFSWDIPLTEPIIEACIDIIGETYIDLFRFVFNSYILYAVFTIPFWLFYWIRGCFK